MRLGTLLFDGDIEEATAYYQKMLEEDAARAARNKKKRGIFTE